MSTSTPLLSALEAATLLGVSRVHIARLCANGTLAHQRIGSSLAIDRASVLAARARRGKGRPRKAKGIDIVKALRAKGHDSLADEVQAVMGLPVKGWKDRFKEIGI